MIGKKLEEKLRAWTPIWRPRRYQATLVGMVVAAIVVPLAILAIPYLEILNDMAVQPKGKAQGYYGWFSDEAIIVDRPPVAGTLPMNAGWMPYDIPGGDEEARKRAGETLENPVPRTKAAIELGRKYFNVFCIVCHGPRADGDGLIVGPNLFPAPPSLHTEAARNYPDGRIFHVITRGQNKMPSYADKLSPDERWSVIHYVRALQLAREMSEEEGDK